MFRLHLLGSIQKHCVVHRVRQVFRQESYVNDAKLGHLGDVFGVTGNIHLELAKPQHVAIPPSLRMEELTIGTFVHQIVGRHSLNGKD